LVRGIIPCFPFKMRYVFEEQQGLSAARNRAVAEASGEYLAFLDDECTVNADWLSIVISDIEAYHPCVIGGSYIGEFLPGDRPRWFNVEYGNAYFLSRRYEKGFQDEFRASGGNMIVRRGVFEMLRFDVNLGMKSGKLNVGEETDLQDRFLQAHPSEKIFYEPEIIVRHFILPEKMRLSYRISREFVTALANLDKVDQKNFLRALRRALVGVILAPIRCIWRDRATYPFWQNFVYEQVIPPTCFHAGIVAKYLRDRFRGPEY
jgi:glycosyltransferase involved in cell wall biosynthesis